MTNSWCLGPNYLSLCMRQRLHRCVLALFAVLATEGNTSFCAGGNGSGFAGGVHHVVAATGPGGSSGPGAGVGALFAAVPVHGNSFKFCKSHFSQMYITGPLVCLDCCVMPLTVLFLSSGGGATACAGPSTTLAFGSVAAGLSGRSVSSKSLRPAPAYAQKHNSRRPRLSDYVKPVTTPEEVKLFWELYPRFTSASGHTDFYGMTVEYNFLVSERVMSAKGLLYMKTEPLLQSFAKKFVASIAGAQAMHFNAVMQSAAQPSSSQALSKFRSQRRDLLYSQQRRRVLPVLAMLLQY